MKIIRSLAAAILAASLAQSASAQDKSPVTIVNLVEMTGAGRIAGTNFNNGVLLAAKEINAAGGILGRPLNLVTIDTQTNAEVAKAKAKEAVAQEPYAIMGPVFSDMVLATMDETRVLGHGARHHGRDPRRRHPPLHRRRGNHHHDEGPPVAVPHFVHAGDRDAPVRTLHQGSRAGGISGPSLGAERIRQRWV